MGAVGVGGIKREKGVGGNDAYKGWVLLCPAETAARIGRRNVHVCVHHVGQRQCISLRPRACCHLSALYACVQATPNTICLAVPSTICFSH